MERKKRIILEYRTDMKAVPEEIFPLLCPVREYDWIPQWHCDMLYSETGVAELGCVFATDFGDGYGRETWVVCQYAPPGKIGFIRTGTHRTTRYEIYLQQKGSATSLSWKQEITALDAQGNTLVGEHTEERFRALMIPLNRMLAHYLHTGKRLELGMERSPLSPEEEG